MTLRATLDVDSEAFKELKAALAKASDAGAERFSFRGVELVTDYAKYLVEYLAPRFERKP